MEFYMILASYLLRVEISVWNSTLICKIESLSTPEIEIDYIDVLFGNFRTP